MKTLESLCAQYVGPPAPNHIEVIHILDGIAQAFYADPRISRILEAALRRESLSVNRKDDLRHDVYITFTQSVLPKLQSPQSAIGSVKMTTINCVKRLASNRWDSELGESLSIEATADRASVGAANILDRVLGVDGDSEERMIGKLMKDRAKAAIEAALANKDASAKRCSTWVRMSYPIIPDKGEQRKQVPAGKLPKASALAPEANPRYKDLNAPKDPTPEQTKFRAARDALGLTIDTLAERLMIRQATLRSYLDLRVGLPDAVYKAMVELLKEPESKARIAYHKKTANVPVVKIIDDWMRRTGAENSTRLSEILGTTSVVVRRWARPKADGGESRPHPEALFNYEQRVLAFERFKKKKEERGE